MYTQWGKKVKQMSDMGQMPWQQVMQAQAARAREIYEYAKMAGHPYPEAVVAQFAKESGYGDAMSAANNTFGIKVDKDYLRRLDNANIPYTIGDLVTTDEVRNGVRGEEQARFVGFPDVQTNVRAHVEFMNQPRYREAMQAKTPQDYLMALGRAGYATDPNYGPATVALMRDTNRRLNNYNFVYQPPISQEPEPMRPDATVTALTPRPVEQLLPINGINRSGTSRRSKIFYWWLWC
jgi:flagellum-specific peptidoglycan hydrolase FlgJ